MSIRFIKAGLQTSIQDSGRFGQMHNGISQSGAMDSVAMQMANWLVSNPINSAVIEVTLVGPVILFDRTMTIAVCGAHFNLYLNNKQVFNNETIQVEQGDILSFKQLISGARAYIAFSGVLDVPSFFSSYSTHLTARFGGYKGRQIQANDKISIRSIRISEKRKIRAAFAMSYTGNYLLRCVSSVESEYFDLEQAPHQSSPAFLSQSFKVSSESNRMGIRLTGKPISLRDNAQNTSGRVSSSQISSSQITSSGLTQGSIQIPPSGLPIISSVDGQTIGGYPRIANIITADLPVLGQLKANDKINFALVDKSLALAILKKKQSRLSFLNSTD